MDESIRQRLLHAEDDLLSAITGDPCAVDNFQKAWSALLLDTERAVKAQTVDQSTITLAHDISSRIAILADSFLDLQVKCQEMGSTFRGDLEAVLSHSGALSPLSPSIYPSTGSAVGPSHASHKWLMKNLHNPYPSPETKQSLAQQCCKSVESINRWFMNARSRIGWTEISKTFFYGSRNDTVDGAYRAFVEDDPKNPLPSGVVFAFMKMKGDAETLYSDRINPSRLAMQIDAAVKDMTPQERTRLDEMKALTVKNEKKRKAEEKEQRRLERVAERERQKAARRASASYPSPARSQAGSPDLSSNEPAADEDEDGDPSSPASLFGHKRRLSDPHAMGLQVDRPVKRPRLGMDQSVQNASSLPSPQSSDVDIHDELSAFFGLHPQNPPSPSTPSTHTATDICTVVPTPSRKRRLSDADSHGVPKRPRGLPAGPRLQAASDPIPMSSALSMAWNPDFSWLSEAFELPEPATTGTLDTSEDLYVDLFRDWCIPADDVGADASTPGLSPDIGPALLIPEFGLPKHNVDAGSTEQNALPRTDVTSFNDWSTTEHVSAGNDSARNPSPPAPEMPVPVPHDLSGLPVTNSDQFDDFLKLVDGSINTLRPPDQDLSPPPSFLGSSDPANSIASLTWSRLPHINSTGDQTPLHPITGHCMEEITSFDLDDNFSPLHFPPAPSDLYARHPDDAASRLKQEKFDQLRIHEEAARRLKEELAVVSW